MYDFDAAVIGCGPAGISVTAMCSAMGLRVVVVDRRPRSGGECMNCGCIPSKVWLHLAESVETACERLAASGAPDAQLRALRGAGVDTRALEEDLTEIAERKMAKMLGSAVKKFGCEARLVSGNLHKVEHRPVGDDGPYASFTARYIFLCVGTRPAVPTEQDLPGITALQRLCRVVTNDTLFQVHPAGKNFVILGGGAIAVEMADALGALAESVTLVQRSQILRTACSCEATDLLRKQLTTSPHRRITLLEGAVIENLTVPPGSDSSAVPAEAEFSYLVKGDSIQRKAHYLLVATGREFSSVCASLRLGECGIRTHADTGAVWVDPFLRTNVPHVYAVGDINGYCQFSSSAMHQGMIALMNTLVPLRFMKADYRSFPVPRTVFTTPSISVVGPTEAELKRKNVKYQVFYARYADYGMTYALGDRAGYVKAYLTPLGKFLSFEIVGTNGAEMISSASLLLANGMYAMSLLKTVFSFPGYSFGLLQNVANQWAMRLCKDQPLIRDVIAFLWRNPRVSYWLFALSPLIVALLCAAFALITYKLVF